MPKFSTTVVYNSPEKIKIKKNVDIFRHLNFVRNNKPIILYQGFSLWEEVSRILLIT